MGKRQGDRILRSCWMDCLMRHFMGTGGHSAISSLDRRVHFIWNNPEFIKHSFRRKIAKHLSANRLHRKVANPIWNKRFTSCHRLRNFL